MSDTAHIINGIPMMLDLDEVIQNCMAQGLYEPIETGWVRERIGSGAVFVDVGANVGWFTSLALSLVGSAGHVFAFEPSPVAFARLSANLGQYPNLTLINSAVGRRPGDLTLYLPKNMNVHSPSAFECPGDFRPVTVPMVSLDTFRELAAVPAIDFVKMDVEGSEPDVLEGMVGLIAAGKVRRVMCEFNSWWLNANKTTIAQLADRFERLGFEIEARTEWQRGPATGGGTFDVQDVLYRYVGRSRAVSLAGLWSAIKSIGRRDRADRSNPA